MSEVESTGSGSGDADRPHDYQNPFSPLVTGTMYLSADGCIHQLSEEAAALMRVKAADEHVGKLPFTSGVWAGSDVQPEFWCGVSGTSQQPRIVTAFYRSTGCIAKFECTVTPIQLSTQRLHSRAAFREVTTEVQGQCRVRWHSRVLEMIAGRAEINEILNVLAEAARAIFEADCATIRVTYLDPDAAISPVHVSQGGRTDKECGIGTGELPPAPMSWKKPIYDLGESVGHSIAELEVKHVRFPSEHDMVAQTLAHLASVALGNHWQDVRLMMLREAERKILGIQLHNDLLQRLSGLHNLVGMDDDSRIHEEIDACTKSIRNLSFAYYPALEVHGLEAAIGKLLEDEAHRSLWRTKCTVSLANASADVETVLFRTVQEALRNAAKHAKASEVTVEISQVGDRIVTVVEDDGVGLQGSAHKSRKGLPHQLGIAGSRLSIEQLGGRFDVVDRKGSGTRVVFEVPARASLGRRVRAAGRQREG